MGSPPQKKILIAKISLNFSNRRTLGGWGDNVGTILESPPPKIWERGKRPKFGAIFLTTLDFHREYLQNGWKCQKSEKNLINYNPFHVGRNKFGEFWSTNKKFY